MGPSFNLTKVTKHCNICDTILLNQTCVHCLCLAKPIYRLWVVVKERAMFIVGARQGVPMLLPQKTQNSLSDAHNNHCIFPYHNRLSGDRLYCPRVSGPKFWLGNTTY